MLAGFLSSDEVEAAEAAGEDTYGLGVPRLNISYKPQKISPRFEGTVRQLLHAKIRDLYMHPQFNTDVMKPMLMEQLLDQEVKHLSGGELQRVAICLALGKPADIYLIDEPSAYLDSEQRIVAAKVIKRFILCVWSFFSYFFSSALFCCRDGVARAASLRRSVAPSFSSPIRRGSSPVRSPPTRRCDLHSPSPTTTARTRAHTLFAANQPLEENRVHCRARFHHGHVPCRSGRRLRGAPGY
jgi:hypothetical protein